MLCSGRIADEKMARLHLFALGAELTVFAREHADYTGVKVEGPFKGGHNSYATTRFFGFVH